MRLVWLAPILLAVQAALAVHGLAAEAVSARCLFIAIQCVALAVISVRYRHDATPIRALWLLLALSLGMQVLWASTNLMAQVLGDPHGWLTTLGVTLSGLYMIPSMLMIARSFDRREPKAVLALDLALSMVVAILLCALVFRIIGGGGPQAAEIYIIIHHADAIDFTLAILASLRLLGIRSAQGRYFYLCAALFLWLNAIAAAIYNRIELAGLPSWSIPLIGIAYVALALAVARPTPRWLRRYRPSRRLAQTIGSFAPVAISLAVLLLAISVSRLSYGLGMLAATASVLLYALRVAFIQSRSQDMQRVAQLNNQRLQQQVGRDPLTGIANRSLLDTRLPAICWDSARQGRPCALLMVDIDFFKQFNDSQGHLAGDECLIKVATVLAANVTAPQGLVARYGGEEFAIVLPATPEPAAIGIAERLIDAIARIDIPHPQSPLGRVSVSIGIAGRVCTDAGDAVTLLEQADQALYRAKTHGRNRYETACWGATPVTPAASPSAS
ncbi:MAG TPA: GGDEF domain-containing protein [Dyella sp.]|uniref:GGDEF domain-containing protein n=1 Tax=Dyella sp. TaxID=1869338 RepID=UPI002F92F786